MFVHRTGSGWGQLEAGGQLWRAQTSKCERKQWEGKQGEGRARQL